MKKALKEHSLLIAALCILIVAQIVGKYASYTINLSSFHILMLLHPLVILSYSFMFIRGIIWIFVLKKFKLSYAYPFMSLAYIFVFVFSYLIFGEQFTWFKLFSIFIIIFGVSLMALDGNSSNSNNSGENKMGVEARGDVNIC